MATSDFISQISALKENAQNDPEILVAVGSELGNQIMSGANQYLDRAVQEIEKGNFDNAQDALNDAVKAVEHADKIGTHITIYQGAGLGADFLHPETGAEDFGKATNLGNVAGTLIKGGVGALTGGPIGAATDWFLKKMSGGKIAPITAINKAVDKKVADPLSRTDFAQALEGAVSGAWQNTIGRVTNLEVGESQEMYEAPDGRFYGDKDSVKHMWALAQGVDPENVDDMMDPRTQTISNKPGKNLAEFGQFLFDAVNPLEWGEAFSGPPVGLWQGASAEEKAEMKEYEDEIGKLTVEQGTKEAQEKAEMLEAMDEWGKHRKIYTSEANQFGLPEPGSDYYDSETGQMVDQTYIDHAVKHQQPIGIYGPSDDVSGPAPDKQVFNPWEAESREGFDHYYKGFAEEGGPGAIGEQGAPGTAGVSQEAQEKTDALPKNWSNDPFFGPIFTHDGQSFIPGMNRWMYQSPDDENWWWDQGSNNWMYAHEEEGSGKWLFGHNENAWAHESNYQSKPYEDWAFTTRGAEEEEARRQSEELRLLSERASEMASTRAQSFADSMGDRISDRTGAQASERMSDRMEAVPEKTGVVEWGALEEVDDRMSDKMEILKERASMRFGG